jgi:hypothetical protein
MALERLGQSAAMANWHAPEVNRFVSTPEQLLALRLSQELNDSEHKEMFLHLCKHTRREIIEDALSFVIDANAKHKGKLFFWKVGQISREWQAQGKTPRRQLSPTPAKAVNLGQQQTLFG